MSGRGGAALYTPEILALAVALADYPLTDELPLSAEAHSRVCGSRVALGLATGADGSITGSGARVTACAIGQSAAAIFLRAASGRNSAAISAALTGLEAWLGGDERMPDWPGIELLAPARPYSGRHAAILLPWKAALAALSNPARAD